MKNNQKEMFDAWLERQLSEEDALVFEKARDLDPALDEECLIMEDILAVLSEMDENLKPSPQFHGNLMQRLTAELVEMTEVPQADPSEGGNGPMKEKNTNTPHIQALEADEGKKESQESKGWLNRLKAQFTPGGRSPWLPVAVGALALVVVVSVGWQGLMSGFRMGSQSTADEAPSYTMGAPGDYIRDGGANEEMGEGVYGMGGGEAAPKPGSPVLPPNDTGSVVPDPLTQKIIFNGYMRIEVDSFDTVIRSLKEAVAGMGGYIVSEQRYNMDDQGRVGGQIVLRVPYQDFDAILHQTGGLGKVLEQTSNATDVTTEFVDVQARIGVMEAKETRLLELLEQTGSLADVLAVEQELGYTRAELESLKGRMRYLTNQTDYSTLTVNLQEKPLQASEIKIDGFAGFLLRVKEAFYLGVNGLLRGVSDLLVWLVRSLPTLVLVGAVLYFFWRRWVKAWWLSRK